MRRLIIFALFLCGASVASAQEQERKLMDRILKPNMELQNSVETKQFVVRGNTEVKQTRWKSFFVSKRPAEKEFTTSAFHAKQFNTKASRFNGAQANLSTRSRIAKADVPYPVPGYAGVKTARDSNKTAETSSFVDSERPFLVQGTRQKILDQQPKPMTIEEVRELLNKNK